MSSIRTIRAEFAGSINGVSGWFDNVIGNVDTKIVRNQTWVSERRDHNKKERLQVKIRFDDECNNGHESFSITATMYDSTGRDIAGGCLHDDIAKTFPELASLIKWHLCSTDGPMHYVANTCYHAGNKDHWGLSKGELKYGKETPHAIGNIPAKYEWCEKYRRPDGALPLEYISPNYVGTIESKLLPEVRTVGEGKARDLPAARNCAVWPEATDDQLCAPRHVLENLLKDRLPALVAEFHETMRNCGFILLRD